MLYTLQLDFTNSGNTKAVVFDGKEFPVKTSVSYDEIASMYNVVADKSDIEVVEKYIDTIVVTCSAPLDVQFVPRTCK